MKKLFNKIMIYIRPFLNWRFIVSYGIVWSWHLLLYLAIAIGIIFKITWLYSACITFYGILWLPWCQENLFQIPLAILLHSKLFKNDQKTKDLLNKMYEEAKLDFLKFKVRFHKKKGRECFMKKDKDIYVYSIKLEGYLRENGFNCEKIIPNIKYPNLNVFVHKYSDELAQLITDYIESVKGES